MGEDRLTMHESEPFLNSPTIGLSRLDRVNIALEFMQSPLGQRIKNALINRLRRTGTETLESLLNGTSTVTDAVNALLEDDSMPDPRLADLASGAIDLQPEDGPSLDDMYDSTILRVNASDALDFFVASDIEQDLGAFMLFFDPQMPVHQAAQLLQSFKEIMPGSMIVQGPLANIPDQSVDGEEPEDGEDSDGSDFPFNQDDEEEPDADNQDQGDDDEAPDDADDQDNPFATDDGEQEPEEPENGDKQNPEEPEDEIEVPDDGDDDDDFNLNIDLDKDDDEDDDEEDDEEDDEKDESINRMIDSILEDGEAGPELQTNQQQSMAPQFDNTPGSKPWVFLIVSDEVNLAKDGSVAPPEDDSQDQGINGFPSKDDSGQDDQPGDDKSNENPFAQSQEQPSDDDGEGDEEPEDGEENPFASDDEEPEDGEEPEDDEENPFASDDEETPSDDTTPGDGEPPGDGDMPGDGEMPGPDSDDGDDDDSDDDDDEDDEEEEEDEDSPSFLYDHYVDRMLKED